MPIATKVKTNLVSGDFAKQIQENMTIDEPEVKKEEIIESRGKYSDVANLHFSTGYKSKFKSFFAEHEITLVQGVELCVNYILKEVKAGNLSISRNGIETKEGKVI